MSTKLDLAKVRALLAEVYVCDEKIADRGPIKVLPRPADEVPNVPALKARKVGSTKNTMGLTMFPVPSSSSDTAMM